MTPEIVSIFVALFIHIAVYFVLLIIIDVKHAGGSARDAFSCFTVILKNCKQRNEFICLIETFPRDGRNQNQKKVKYEAAISLRKNITALETVMSKLKTCEFKRFCMNHGIRAKRLQWF
jgi:hypothetical protein